MPIYSEIVSQVLKGLQKVANKEIPFSLLYDMKGSDLYEQITHLEEYYPFRAEESLITEHAAAIASSIPVGSLVVELGCGTARKTAGILSAIQARHGSCRFVGIDVSGLFLEEASVNLSREVRGLRSENLEFVQADYMEGLKQVREHHPKDMLSILWLGSSVGNLSEPDAITFFRDVFTAVGSHCQILLCTDMWKDVTRLFAAYHDKEGVTEMFIKNGMRNALSVLVGREVTAEEERSWVYEVDVNERLRRVEMYVQFPVGLTIPQRNVNIRSGERVLVEVSRKFTVSDLQRLATESGFHIHAAWRNKTYGIQMLLPFEEAVLRCWKDTDAFFSEIKDWTVKPIDVRHPFCFYHGHVCAFAKLKLLPYESPSHLDVTFSRGIDPVVVDPSKCHQHPEVPAQWPSREEVVTYVQKTRAAILDAISTCKASPRLIVLALEHERMHLETLAYMQLQQTRVAFEKQFESANGSSIAHLLPTKLQSSVNTTSPVHTPQHTVRISPGKVVLGANPKEGGFFWDNEYPKLHTSVSEAFWVSSMPVTVGEFHKFIMEMGYEREEFWEAIDFQFFSNRGCKCPASWSKVQGEYFVHTPWHSSAHWKKVADQPVFVSLSEAQAFCKWTGCRIMSEVEYHRILDSGASIKVQHLRDGGWEWTATCFAPFPGFQAMDEYPEYSRDFFDGSHYVLKGASPVTHTSLCRDSFRNFYQRQYPYVFAKFRCCK